MKYYCQYLVGEKNHQRIILKNEKPNRHNAYYVYLFFIDKTLVKLDYIENFHVIKKKINPTIKKIL